MKIVSTRKSLFFLIAFIFLTLFINRINFIRGIKNKFINILAPALTASFKISRETSDILSRLTKTSNSLRSENTYLLAQLLEYKKYKADALRFQEENSSLLNLLHYASSTLNKIPAQVIGLGTENTVQSIIIDRGSDNHIKKGDAVIAEDGVLIGTIWKLEEKESLVELVTDNQSRIGASLLNGDKSMGLAVGSHGVSVQIEMIPQNESVKTGDVAITSGLEKNIPRGLVIGTVTSIKKEASEPFQTARLELPVELNKLSWVAVLSQ